MSLDILMLAGLAAFVVYLLYDTLGKSPPPEAEQRALREAGRKVVANANQEDLSKAQAQRLEFEDSMLAPGADREAILAGLHDIQRQDPEFRASEFLSGARAAFNLVIEGFAKSDRDLLSGLLSREVYQGFDAAIKDREAQALTSLNRIERLDSLGFQSVEVSQGTAAIVLDIRSQQVLAYRDASGELLEGDTETPQSVGNRWTFVRALGSSDPNWSLAATDDLD